MRAVVQRVSKAAVSVDQQEIGKIGYGLLVLLGIHETDTQKDVDYLVKKIAQMRIFEDEQGKMNISVEDVGGQILSISQFTLFADTKKEIDQALWKPHDQKQLFLYTNHSMKESEVAASQSLPDNLEQICRFLSSMMDL